jgi:hypothetical protein
MPQREALPPPRLARTFVELPGIEKILEIGDATKYANLAEI